MENAVARALQAYRGSYTHPNVLKARVARAQTFAEQGNLEFAIGEMSHVIDDAAILFGPSAFIVGVDLLHFARLQLRAGYVPIAVGSADRVEQLLGKAFGPTCPSAVRLRELRLAAVAGEKR